MTSMDLNLRRGSTGETSGWPTYDFVNAKFTSNVDPPMRWPKKAIHEKTVLVEVKTDADKKKVYDDVRGIHNDPMKIGCAKLCCAYPSIGYAAVDKFLDDRQNDHKLKKIPNYWICSGQPFWAHLASVCCVPVFCLGLPSLCYLEQMQANRVATALKLSPPWVCCYCGAPSHREVLYWYLFDMDLNPPRRPRTNKMTRINRYGPKLQSKFAAEEEDGALEAKIDLFRAIKKQKKAGFIVQGDKDLDPSMDPEEMPPDQYADPAVNPFEDVDTPAGMEAMKKAHTSANFTSLHAKEIKPIWDETWQNVPASEKESFTMEEMIYAVRRDLKKKFKQGEWSIYEERVKGGDAEDGVYYVFVRNPPPEDKAAKELRISNMRDQLKNDANEPNDCADLAVTMYEIVAGTHRGVSKRATEGYKYIRGQS